MISRVSAVALLAMSLAIGGCATPTAPRARPEPEIRTVETLVPVDDPRCAREAIARLGPEPAYPDTPAALRAAPDIFARTALLLAGRTMREARRAAVEEALRACAR